MNAADLIDAIAEGKADVPLNSLPQTQSELPQPPQSATQSPAAAPSSADRGSQKRVSLHMSTAVRLTLFEIPVAGTCVNAEFFPIPNL